MRLEDLVGCAGLRSRGERSELRAAALRAMQYCPDFSELSWLANVARDGQDAEARLALEDASTSSPRAPGGPPIPRTATKCTPAAVRSWTLANDPSRARPLRLLAIRALRMLTDRGCVAPADGPATGRD